LRVLKIFLIVFLIITATVSGAALSFIENLGRFPHIPPLPLPRPLPESGDMPPPASFVIPAMQGAVNILIVGLDDVDSSQRADAIALARIEQDRKFVRVMAIPRDSRVQIPGRGWDKINHAYVYGGLDLLKSTVMNLMNVGIDYFVVVNYDAFPRIINLLGGIDIYVEKKLVYTDYSGKLFINIPQGQQHMNGKTALEYVRFRHDPLGDIGRVQRQQKFISILMEKLKSPSIIWKIPSLVDEALSALNTDLSPMDGIRLAQFVSSLPNRRIELLMAPGRAAYIGNVSYWIIDVQAASIAYIRDIEEKPAVGGDVVSNDLPVVSRREEIQDLLPRIGKIGILNGDGASGLGRRASQVFQKLGVDVAYTSNARHFDYHSSNIIYPGNATERDKEAAEALAKLCGITSRALIRSDRTATMVCVVLGHDKENIFKRLENASF
jgi:LCP family protein required for cell wall assembly